MMSSFFQVFWPPSLPKFRLSPKWKMLMSFKSPNALGGTPVSLMLYVEDVDSVFKKAIELGATEVRPVHDQFYGDRAGTLQDPFGHIWTIGTHKEDLSEQEINQRMADLMSKEQDA